jgi:hypothetical protein
MRRLLVAALILGLAGCASSPVSRIDSNRAAYESWPLDVQEAVLNGRAIKGMTPEQVEMAMGKPSEINTRSAQGDEVWIYRKSGGAGSSVLNNSNISLGIPIGNAGIISAPVGLGRPTTPEEEEVIFEKGVVIKER